MHGIGEEMEYWWRREKGVCMRGGNGAVVQYVFLYPCEVVDTALFTSRSPPLVSVRV